MLPDKIAAGSLFFVAGAARFQRSFLRDSVFSGRILVDAPEISPEPHRSHVQTLNGRKGRGILKRNSESRVWELCGADKRSDALQMGVLQLILPKLMRNQQDLPCS